MTARELDAMMDTLGAMRPTLDDVLALVSCEPPARRPRLEADEALASSALYYASVGWPIFPLVPGGKTPITKHGLKDASTDVATVASWWKRQPLANIGVATGVRFDVIDIDAPDGFASFVEYGEHVRTAGYPLPLVLAVAWTGGNGRHLFIEARGAGNRAGIMPGLDYRGAGGYVVLPPSRLDNGGRYAWVAPPRPQLVGAT